MAGFKAKMEQDVRAYDEDWRWQLPDVGIMQNAKAYRDKTALPLVNKLKELVKSLAVKCAGLMEQVRRLTEQVKRLSGEVSWYKGKTRQQYEEIEVLREKSEDMERVRRYARADKVKEMIDSVKREDCLERERGRLQTIGNRRMSR